MAESLARALRNAEDEIPLRDEGYDDEEEDPLFCDGKPLCLSFLLLDQYFSNVDADDAGEFAENLGRHWFGTDAHAKWFPYPDKAVRIFHR